MSIGCLIPAIDPLVGAWCGLRILITECPLHGWVIRAEPWVSSLAGVDAPVCKVAATIAGVATNAAGSPHPLYGVATTAPASLQPPRGVATTAAGSPQPPRGVTT